MDGPLDLFGKTILVTGATSGIGRETAALLHRLRATVLLNGRRADVLDSLVAELGSRAVATPFDVTDVDGIPSWMAALAVQSGPLHGVVHSAGLHLQLPLGMTTAADFRRVLTVNLEAAMGLARGLRQKAVAAPAGGSLVFLSSVMGVVGQAGVAAYAASKGGVLALTKSLALELAPQKIRVNCILAAMVETEMMQAMRQKWTAEQAAKVERLHPLGFGQPIDVAHAVAFLLAETGRWCTGSALTIDGGYTAH